MKAGLRCGNVELRWRAARAMSALAKSLPTPCGMPSVLCPDAAANIAFCCCLLTVGMGDYFLEFSVESSQSASCSHDGAESGTDVDCRASCRHFGNSCGSGAGTRAAASRAGGCGQSATAVVRVVAHEHSTNRVSGNVSIETFLSSIAISSSFVSCGL